jgi:hypothetical protein
MQMQKVQKYLAIAVISLVVIFIGVRIVTNYISKQVKWEEGDKDAMVNELLEDLEGRAIRFPKASTEYCECVADTLMVHYTKSEYLLIESKSYLEKKKEFLPVIAECYSTYNAAMFDASVLGDD